MKTVLCLFEQSKTFANLYGKAGYNVVSVDLELGIDIMTFDYKAYSNVDTIISHPPCTEFAVSGARWWANKPVELLQHAIQLVNKTIEIIEYHNPRVWFIENPIGRIEKCVPQMRNFPKFTFNPFQYAGYSDTPNEEAYTKKTVLWGSFSIPKQKAIEPVLGSKMHKLGWATPEVKRQRSITPQGFARAFVEANLNNTACKQLTLI